MTRIKQIERIMEELQGGVNDLFDSKSYQEYLDTMSRFHQYSFNNSLLIYRQMPEATLVAGYRTWQKVFKRQVRKHEKAIRILAPYTYYLEDEEKEEKKCIGFKPAFVFDISQTDGKPLPSVIDQHLKKPIEDYESFRDALMLISKAPVHFKELEKSINGFYHPHEKIIVIQKGMSPLKTLKTLVHEMAHSMMHDGKAIDETTREIQAESVAYVVLKHYGFDTSDYSFGYILLWAKEKEYYQKCACMEEIVECASTIIERVNQVRHQQTGHAYVYEAMQDLEKLKKPMDSHQLQQS